ncbi:hypothetical protein CMV_001603 [Castanea mollissima]|uniref:Uncharacterized protein n=1 Tax=Castanea mollissima TaxID=60419 RepID=A0A8J4RVP6_9ROSI|nr:hypothetical protein CMV_001603 [Castanea mollissima]
MVTKWSPHLAARLAGPTQPSILLLTFSRFRTRLLRLLFLYNKHALRFSIYLSLSLSGFRSGALSLAVLGLVFAVKNGRRI